MGLDHKAPVLQYINACIWQRLLSVDVFTYKKQDWFCTSLVIFSHLLRKLLRAINLNINLNLGAIKQYFSNLLKFHLYANS